MASTIERRKSKLRKLNKFSKRIIAFLLCTFMICTDPISVFATGTEQTIDSSSSCSCDTVDDIHQSNCELYVAFSIYKQLNTTNTLTDFRAILLAEENEEDVLALTEEQINTLISKVESLYATIDNPSEDDTAIKEEMIETLTILPAMECSECGEFGNHADDCIKNVAVSATPVDDYIYLDLSAGDIELSLNTATGYRYDGNSTPTLFNESIGSKFVYVYQSNGNKDTGIINNQLVLPNYTGVSYDGKTWGEYITNNSNVEEVISSWNNIAPSTNRKSTPHRIKATENCVGTYKLILDNIWSSYQTQGAQYAQNRITGAISFIPPHGSSGKMYIQLIGDNRLGNIHYDSYRKQDSGGNLLAGNVDINVVDFDNRLYIEDYPEDSKTGTLTVANIQSNADNNYLSSAIGGSDGYDTSTGIIINSGIIYAGTNQRDNSTAIGGGGNGYGHVTINGGIVTAVSSSSGTAIGGGIGTTGYGGAGEVYINNGDVYAYNFGPYKFDGQNYWSSEDQQAGRTYPSYNAYPVAIGGGSSTRMYGSPIAKVEIKNGNVYAQSTGGAAIGGGGSACVEAGSTEVIISGGNVTAKSISGTWDDANEIIPAGVGIGGGTGKTKGGDAKVTISGNAIIKTGSIGGGQAFDANAPIGSANVEIKGGTIQGQIIMMAGAETPCSFAMSNGVIDNSTKDDSFVFLKENGGAVYVENGNATMSNGTIQKCDDAIDGGAIYLANGTFIMSGGKIENNEAAGNGGAVCVVGGTCQLTGGEISNNEATGNGGGIYVENTNVSLGGTTGISILNNKATNGGGIYTDAGDISIENGTISENEASNGGGICAINGSDVTMTGQTAFLTYNKANGQPSATITTAYNTSLDSLVGVGGGIFIANGATGSDPDPTSFIMNAEKVGIFGNSAGFAADDVFANASNTTLKVPDVRNMDLAGINGVKPTGWFEDYAEGDTSYAFGLNGNSTISGKRYKTAGVNIVPVEENFDQPFIEYICMTIGLGRGSLTITKCSGDGKNLDSNQTFIFHVTGDPLDGSTDIDLYITINGAGSETIYNLPYGNYTISECTDWSWRYDVVKCELIKTLNNSTKETIEDSTTLLNDENKTPEFKVTNKLEKENWLSFVTSIKNIFGKTNN